MLLCLLPNFHPEKYLLNKYYWQVDMLIHFTYLFSVMIFVKFFFYSVDIKTLLLYALSGAVMIELLQYFVPGRSVTVIDLISNVLGVLAGSFLGSYLNRLYKERSVKYIKNTICL